MCLGTQQRQRAEGDPSHGFRPFIMAGLHCRTRLYRQTAVYSGMTWVGLFSLCSAHFPIATLHRGRLWDAIAFVATARPPP